jgi:3-hydroxyphenylacetate 6-hydroxylase
MIERTLTTIYTTLHTTLTHSPLLFITGILTLLALTYILATELYRARVRIPDFPGPTGLPVLGNIHQIRTNAAEQYRIWARTYGPVFQISLGTVPVIVVNSAKAAREIFGANSQALASRPEFYTFHKVVSSTAGTTVGTSPFSESLKRRRKGAASALNKPSVNSYVPLIDTETRDFVKEFLEYGEEGRTKVDPMPMIQRLSLSLALTLNWGVRMKTQDDELFEEITEVEEEVSKTRSTTGNLQDYVPILRYVPAWLKGGVSGKAGEYRRRRDVYLKKLNDDLEQRMAQGWEGKCIQANVMRDREARLNQEELTSISLTM